MMILQVKLCWQQPTFFIGAKTYHLHATADGNWWIGLGIRNGSSLQQCYLHCICTTLQTIKQAVSYTHLTLPTILRV